MHRLLTHLAMAAAANAAMLLNGLEVLEDALSRAPADTATCTGQVVVQSQDCGDCSVRAVGGLVGVQYHCLPWSVVTFTTAVSTVTIPVSVEASTTAISTSVSSSTVVSTDLAAIPSAPITSSLSTPLSFTTTTRPSLTSTTPSATAEPHKAFVHSPGGVGLFATLGLLCFFAIIGALSFYTNKRESQKTNKPEAPPDEVELQRPTSSIYDSDTTAVPPPDSPGPYMNWYTGEYYPASPKQTPELDQVARSYRTNAWNAAMGRSGSPVRRGIREGPTPYDMPLH